MGRWIGITHDQPIFVKWGDLASHEVSLPMLTHVVRTRLFWLGRRPLTQGATYRLKLATRIAAVTVQSVDALIDIERLSSATADSIGTHQIGEVTLRSTSTFAVNEFTANSALGRFVLLDGDDMVGAGIISMEGFPDERPAPTGTERNLFTAAHLLDAEARNRRNGHRGAVIWFTGLSGAGKSTLAMEVERRLFLRGYHVYVLDGDNVRRGLNSDLGFAPEDRLENIRRIGEMAALFADAGIIVVTAFISPYIADRARAREAAKGAFHEIYIKADLATCERRDPKGLYKRARAGEIADFTGVSAPYEEPTSAELVVETGTQAIEQSVETILDYIEGRIALNPAKVVAD